MFSLTSRYQGISTAMLELPDGRTVVYVRRRLLPRPEDLTQIGEHVVRRGERLDHIAFAEFGDAEQWWRIADAHRYTRLDDLTVAGRRLRITLPVGLPRGGLVPPTPGGGHGR